MKVREIVELLHCNLVCGDSFLDQEVDMAFASDLMSDVLTVKPTGILLITGLANLQAIRTAEVAEFQVILFVRNKKVSPDMLSLAKESDMVVLECPYSMFRACGVLFQYGLNPVF